MPGYASIPDSLAGGVADYVREAGRHEQQCDYQQALELYEAALAESLNISCVLPGFLCGRLAALYRRLRRYDDEVELLEAFRASQVCDQARVRYDARLSKARALAFRKQPRDSGALASVRALKKPAPRRPRNEEW